MFAAICVAAFVIVLLADALALRWFTRVRRVGFYNGAGRRNRGDS